MFKSIIRLFLIVKRFWENSNSLKHVLTAVILILLLFGWTAEITGSVLFNFEGEYWTCLTTSTLPIFRHQWRLPRWTSPCLLLLYKRRMLRPLFVISLYIEFTSKTKIPKRWLLAALQKLVCSSHVSPSVRQGNVFRTTYTLKNSHEGPCIS